MTLPSPPLLGERPGTGTVGQRIRELELPRSMGFKTQEARGIAETAVTGGEIPRIPPPGLTTIVEGDPRTPVAQEDRVSAGRPAGTRPTVRPPHTGRTPTVPSGPG